MSWSIILTTPRQALPHTLLAPVLPVLLLYTCGLHPCGHGVIARRPVVGDASVGKHVGNILVELDLPPDEDVHRRVQAVLAYPRARAGRSGTG